MENRELVRRIEEQQVTQEAGRALADVRIFKFLVFSVRDKPYALYASDVREIVGEIPLFFVPFVPPYVRGFINRHGEPHTVFDLSVLFEKEKLESSNYLILNVENDQIAFVISDVVEIRKVEESAVHLITSIDETEGYFLGSFSTGAGEIFILNLPMLRERLTHDLAS